MNVTIWNEGIHEELYPKIKEHYPNCIHGTLAEIIGELPQVDNVHIATLEQEGCGLPDEILDKTDVLLWWGHMAHDRVPDELVAKIHHRVLQGMGLMVLHSAHFSKIFIKLMGTSCCLSWKEDTYERLFCVKPSHPIAAGIPSHFELGKEETYGEFFDVPDPDETIFLGWFDSGELFRSGCTWHRGYGKVFYFQPGHETNPTYNHEYIRKIIQNACIWLAPSNTIEYITSPYIEKTLEEIRKTK
ncbi:MAG: ThuA domain-containing protein [Oscillospiraceae bacterium]|nr:ThuA domain-containing protein [Oscillospiraceae bacterium]